MKIVYKESMTLVADSLSLEIPVRSGCETVQFLPERAVYWPARKILMVTDLHWGKSQTFRAHGIPIPGGVLADDLARLDRAVAKTGAERIVILGDLIHGKLGVTDDLIDRIAEWRQNSPVDMLLVRGNHDRHYRDLPACWNIDAVDDYCSEGPFVFAHHPEPVDDFYVWSGHIHPTVVLRGGRDRLRMPCFYLMETIGVLPAFSFFTGGFNIRKQPGERIVAIVENDLVEL